MTAAVESSYDGLPEDALEQVYSRLELLFWAIEGSGEVGIGGSKCNGGVLQIIMDAQAGIRDAKKAIGALRGE